MQDNVSLSHCHEAVVIVNVGLINDRICECDNVTRSGTHCHHDLLNVARNMLHAEQYRLNSLMLHRYTDTISGRTVSWSKNSLGEAWLVDWEMTMTLTHDDSLSHRWNVIRYCYVTTVCSQSNAMIAGRRLNTNLHKVLSLCSGTCDVWWDLSSCILTYCWVPRWMNCENCLIFGEVMTQKTVVNLTNTLLTESVTICFFLPLRTATQTNLTN